MSVSARLSSRFSLRRFTHKEAGPKWTNRIALGLVLATFLFCLVHVLLRGQQRPSDKPVLTLAHWQLEAGVRDGFDTMSRKYIENLSRMLRSSDAQDQAHARLALGSEFEGALARVKRGETPIEFEQVPVTERGYGQWVTTQLMGGTATDLIEMNGGGLDWSIWVNYRARYFVPLTREIVQPNPYNAGADIEYMLKLKNGRQYFRVRRDGENYLVQTGDKIEPVAASGVAAIRKQTWKETYFNGMGQVIPELQEYYDVGLSLFNGRLFYNPELLEKLTTQLAQAGKLKAPLQEPPEDLREFLRVCDLISTLKDENGNPYRPLAGSKTTNALMQWMMFSPLTGVFLNDIDRNLDGWPATEETFFALLEKKFSFNDPRLLKITSLQRELARRFQPGWNGLNRDDAVMLFVQQRALFIATGSWEALGLKTQAETSPHPFKVAITRFPMPLPGDPEWGDVALGQMYEEPLVGFSFGLTKVCKHPELALDFMRFLTAQQNDEELNRIIGWIPGIVGAHTSGFLKVFEPNLVGAYQGYDLRLGGRTAVVMDQINQLAQLGEDERGRPFGTSDWAARMSAEWLPAALADYKEKQKVERDGLVAREAVAAVMRSKMLLADNDEQRSYARMRLLSFESWVLDSPRYTLFLQKQLEESQSPKSNVQSPMSATRRLADVQPRNSDLGPWTLDFGLPFEERP